MALLSRRVLSPLTLATAAATALAVARVRTVRTLAGRGARFTVGYIGIVTGSARCAGRATASPVSAPPAVATTSGVCGARPTVFGSAPRILVRRVFARLAFALGTRRV